MIAIDDESLGQLRSQLAQAEADGDQMATEIERLQAALESIAGFGSVDLNGEWGSGLCDIIRSMTDCARRALEQTTPTKPSGRVCIHNVSMSERCPECKANADGVPIAEQKAPREG